MEKVKQIEGAQLVISGIARLCVKTGTEGMVRFNFTAVDGHVPTYGEVFGDNDLLYEAWLAGSANLVVLNTTFRVKVLGRNFFNGALTVESGPMFRALLAGMEIALDWSFVCLN